MESTVHPEQAGNRIDGALAALIPGLTRSKAKQLLDAGRVQLNGVLCKASQKVRTGDLITWEEPTVLPMRADAENIPFAVLYEDDSLLVLNKPAALVVHPAAGNWSGTLVNALLHHGGGLSGVGGTMRPGIVHRLDKDTTGCMVVAKNDAVHLDLSRQFAGRTVAKIYLGLAAGFPRPASGRIEAPIGRDPRHRQRMAVLPEGKGRTARTDYRVVEVIGANSLVECRLFTGRTHQIRVHMKHLGTPLCGDTLYAGRRAGTFPRPMLHAWRLGFTHPLEKKWMEFIAQLPEDFLNAGVQPPPVPNGTLSTST